MAYEIVPLNSDHLDKLLGNSPSPQLAQLSRAYFSPGSVARCLLEDGEPVFAGGIVNMEWHRGVAWILPTPFFRRHVKVCLKGLREHLPRLAREFQFVRVQAECLKGVSAKLFLHLGFDYEGTMRKFGPNGETCDIYARVFEEQT